MYAFDRQTQRLRTYRHDEHNPVSLCDDYVHALSVDRQGHLWIGTGDGFAHMENEQCRTYRSDRPNDHSLSSNHVTAIAQDSRGRVWIGTADQGLNCFDPTGEDFVAYLCDPDDHRSLNNNTISSITRDRSGVLWVGTFGGGINKLVQTKDTSHIPSPVFTSFTVSGRSIALPQTLSTTEQITLSYPDDSFSCEFSVLDFTSPITRQYAYMLEGVDRDWVRSGTQRSAHYANLDDGDYTLRIISRQSDGIWDETGRTLHITVVPPFWKRWWFSLASAATGLLCLSLLYRYRVSRLLEMERTRNRIARDLHDEVGSTLSSISYFADAIRGETAFPHASNTGKLLSLISESSLSARDAMSDIVWAIDPSNDCWEKVAAKLRRFSSDLLESKGIAYSIHIPPTAPYTFPSIEHRRNFWLLFKEMVCNAARHAQCTKVAIDLSVDNTSYCLVVADNGLGFDPEIPSGGNGIGNMRVRAAFLEASLELRTSPGQGTRWQLQHQPSRQSEGYVAILRRTLARLFH